MLTTLFYLFLASICLELIKYLLIYSPVAFKSDKTPKRALQDLPGVSLIVYIKNQQETLPQYLPTLLNQDYPNYQIILVNNASCDDSLDILEAFVKQNPLVKLVNVVNNENFWNNKKYALTLGIKVAQHEHFIFTQPQGTIPSPNWLLSIASYFSNTKKVIIGHTHIPKVKNSLISKLIRYQNTYKTINLFAWTYFSKPLHGNALNQGYTKDLFYKHNGFINQMKTPYGDQYAYINQISTSKNTAIATNKNSFINHVAPNKTSYWLNNFRIHNLLLNTSGFCQRLKSNILSLLPLLTYISFTVLIILQFHWQIVLGLFLLRLIIQYLYNFRLFKKFDNKDLLWLLPVLEITHNFMQIYFILIQFITRKKLEKTYS